MTTSAEQEMDKLAALIAQDAQKGDVPLLERIKTLQALNQYQLGKNKVKKITDEDEGEPSKFEGMRKRMRLVDGGER